MKSLISVLCMLSVSLIQAVGFDGNTLITTASGRLKPIKEASIGDRVACYTKNLELVHGTIKGICVLTVDSTIRITTQDNIDIVVSGLERFFLPKEGAWVCAQDLKTGDCLLNDDLETIAITSVQQSNVPQDLYAITVDTMHNFLASEGKYLVHNGPLAAWQAYWGVKTAAYAALSIAVIGTVTATGGAVLAASSAVAAGTATTATIVTGVGAGIAGTAVGTAAVGSVGAGLAVGTVGAAATIAGGAEFGAMATATATGVSAMVAVSGAGATVGATGVCAATAAAIETAAVAAFMVALTCPFTPW